MDGGKEGMSRVDRGMRDEQRAQGQGGRSTILWEGAL